MTLPDNYDPAFIALSIVTNLDNQHLVKLTVRQIDGPEVYILLDGDEVADLVVSLTEAIVLVSQGTIH
jgi:hypothetical protein